MLHQPVAAREPFNRALVLFERLGAQPWAARARAELEASGVKQQRLGPIASGAARLEALSPQELQVARMAGRGQNNLEVAAALFVSRKTVGSAFDPGLPQAWGPFPDRTSPDSAGQRYPRLTHMQG